MEVKFTEILSMVAESVEHERGLLVMKRKPESVDKLSKVCYVMDDLRDRPGVHGVSVDFDNTTDEFVFGVSSDYLEIDVTNDELMNVISSSNRVVFSPDPDNDGGFIMSIMFDGMW